MYVVTIVYVAYVVCCLFSQGHDSLINRIITCKGNYLFSSSYDRTARCWDFDTGECIRVFTGHTRGVYPLIFIPGDDEEISPESLDWDGNKNILITGRYILLFINNR